MIIEIIEFHFWWLHILVSTSFCSVYLVVALNTQKRSIDRERWGRMSALSALGLSVSYEYCYKLPTLNKVAYLFSPFREKEKLKEREDAWLKIQELATQNPDVRFNFLNK